MPDYNTGGGEDGPYVSADDDVQGGVWYWLAPSTYHGDFSNAYGQSLTFYLQQSSPNGASWLPHGDWRRRAARIIVRQGFESVANTQLPAEDGAV